MMGVVLVVALIAAAALTEALPSRLVTLLEVRVEWKKTRARTIRVLCAAAEFHMQSFASPGMLAAG